MRRYTGILFAAIALFLGCTLVPRQLLAEVQLQFYGGLNGTLPSHVALRKGALTDDRTVDWEGKSFVLPPYWGARAIYWHGSVSGWGVALDFMHAKSYAKINFAADPVYDRLEFTDGNNIVTANLMYRFERIGLGLRPYVGLGVGVAVPHVEVTLDAFPGQKTFEYQLTGIALQALIGVEIPLAERWLAFVEGKMTYTRIDASLKGGGSLETDLWSPHLVIGMAYRF